MVFSKRAVERLLDSCETVQWERGTDPVKLTEDHRKKVLYNMDELAKLGLRVLALAQKALGFERKLLEVNKADREKAESDLCFLGLVGLYDPPRHETAQAVADCHNAGITVHMVTGDHPGTAKAIAQRVGIVPANLSALSADVEKALVMTASEFDGLTEEVDALPDLPHVIARCAPQAKVHMINALHRREAFVAMTGGCQ